MPELEPNLPYASAQQTKPWRAGTPGRAPRYRRAVVDYRRPLCLFTLCLGLLCPLGASAQQSSSRPTALQLRIGIMAFSPLIEDELTSRAITDSMPGQSERLTVQPRVAPAITLAALLPLRERAELELSAGVATSSLRGADDFTEWDLGTFALLHALVGVAYTLRPALIAHGGIGLTRLFGDQAFMEEGNGIRPLLEGGLSFVMPFHHPLQLDARVQTHRFTTTALQNEGASEGTVLRMVFSGSYTMGGAPR